VLLNVYYDHPNNLANRLYGMWQLFPDLPIDEVIGFDNYTKQRGGQSFDGDLIVGGGGMFHEPWQDRLKQMLADCQGTRVLWSNGHDFWGKEQADYPDWLMACELRGMRDWGMPDCDWVPCPTCMLPVFELFRAKAPTQAIVAYEQPARPLRKATTFDRATVALGKDDGTGEHFFKVLSHLASGECVVTSSYHGTYWATLLGRKVIAVPFSSKFYAMRHAPLILPLAKLSDEAVLERVKDAPVYPGALEECRAANVRFKAKVCERLGI